MPCSIRPMLLKEFRHIFKRITEDFPPEEYPPYFVLRAHLRSGRMKGFLLLNGEGDSAGYALCAQPPVEGDPVLLSLFGIDSELRGKGLGSAFLQQLRQFYAESGSIIVEVDMPERAQSAGEKEICEKRIRFYQRAGYVLLTGIKYSIWDVPMHLMVLPLQKSADEIAADIERIMRDLYRSLMGRQFMYKLKLTRTGA